MQSKENSILILFFNESAKHWHFTEIAKKANISKQQANFWLKKFMKEKLIIHVKPKGKMPYFKANFSHPNYQNRKRLFSLTELYRSGFLSHLNQLPKAKTIIIFGSYSSYDWNSESDIDLFIYGDAEGLDTATYWSKLKRKIEPCAYSSLNEMRKIKSGIMKNIINGFVVKGDITEIMGAAA